MSETDNQLGKRNPSNSQTPEDPIPVPGPLVAMLAEPPLQGEETLEVLEAVRPLASLAATVAVVVDQAQEVVAVNSA